MIKRIFYTTLVFIALTMTITLTASAQEYIVKMKDNGVMLFSTDVEPLYAEINLYTADEKTAKQLLESGMVEYIEPNGTVELFSSVYDDMYELEFCPSLVTIGAKAAWEYETFGNDVTIGVIDSGCYPHTEIKDNLLSGKNYVAGYAENYTEDTYKHGTHVSGIIAATLDNSGVAGLAPKAKIVPLKITTNNVDATIDYIISAIKDAVNTYNCDILNLSLGTATHFQSLYDALYDANNKGVILVAAVGNDGNYPSRDINNNGIKDAYELKYPAGYDDLVIGVGAVNDSKQVCDFSQKNNTPDIFAPGQNVMSLDKTDEGYRTDSGTSMACPYVSAAAAIALSFDPTLTPAEVRALITSNTDSINGTWTYNDAGVLSIPKLVQNLLSGREAYTSPLTQTEDGTSATLFNLTDSDMTASSIWFDGESLTDTPFTVDANGKTTLTTPLTPARLFIWNSLNGTIPLANSR